MRGNETDRNVVSKRMDSKQVQETLHLPEQQKTQFPPQEAFQSTLQPRASTKCSVSLGSEHNNFDSPPTGPTHSLPSLSDLIRQRDVSDVGNKPQTPPSESIVILFNRARSTESSTPSSLGDLIRQKRVSETNSTALSRPQAPPTKGSNDRPKSSMPSLSDLIGGRHSVMPPPSLTTSLSGSTDFSSVLDESEDRLSSGSVSHQHAGGAVNAKIQLKTLTRGSPGTSPSLAELMTSSKGMCNSDTGSTLPNKPRGNRGIVGAEKTLGTTPSLADLIRESKGSQRNQEGTKVPSAEVRGSGGDKVPAGGSGGDKVPAGGSGGDKVPVGGSGGDKVPAGGSGGDKVPVGGSEGDKVPAGGSRGDKVPAGGSGGDKVQTSIYQPPLEHKVNSKRGESHGTSLSLADLISKEVSGSDQTGKECSHPRLSDVMVSDKESSGVQIGKECTHPRLSDVVVSDKECAHPRLSDVVVSDKECSHPRLSDVMVSDKESSGVQTSKECAHPRLSDVMVSDKESSGVQTSKECAHPRLSDVMVSDKESTGVQTSKETTLPLLEDLMQKRQHQSPHFGGLNVVQSPVATPSLADLMSKNIESKTVLSHASPSPCEQGTVKGGVPLTKPLTTREPTPHMPAPTLMDLMGSRGTPSGDQILKEKGPHSLIDLMSVKTTRSDMTFLGSTSSSTTIRNTALSSTPLTSLHHHPHGTAILFGAQRDVGNTSAHSEVPSVVLLQPSNASPSAQVVSRRCNSISDRHQSIEAAILKSFRKDWYGGRLRPFSFTTPSPDDVIRNRQKEHIK